jgi:hypothetical protein
VSRRGNCNRPHKRIGRENFVARLKISESKWLTSLVRERLLGMDRTMMKKFLTNNAGT